MNQGTGGSWVNEPMNWFVKQRLIDSWTSEQKDQEFNETGNQ